MAALFFAKFYDIEDSYMDRVLSIKDSTSKESVDTADTDIDIKEEVFMLIDSLAIFALWDIAFDSEVKF